MNRRVFLKLLGVGALVSRMTSSHLLTNLKPDGYIVCGDNSYSKWQFGHFSGNFNTVLDVPEEDFISGKQGQLTLKR